MLIIQQCTLLLVSNYGSSHNVESHNGGPCKLWPQNLQRKYHFSGRSFLSNFDWQKWGFKMKCVSSGGGEKSNTWARMASLSTEAIVPRWLILPADCLGVSALLSFSPFPPPAAQLNCLRASEERTSRTERAGWSQGFLACGLIRSSAALTDKNHESRPASAYNSLHFDSWFQMCCFCMDSSQ